jgi:TPR repeat protein
MQDADSLFYESVQLNLRAKKAPTPAKRDALYAKWYRMTTRVLRVDPTSISAQYNLGVMYEQGKGVQQDYKQAVAWYRKAADQGMADAQYNLGVVYRQGQGVQQDSKQAAAWYRKAAEQTIPTTVDRLALGHAEAQFSLGLMYNKGEGVQQDFKQAVAWWQKAADQGHADAQYNLGVMYV